MSIIKVIFELLVLYVVYKLIFDFIIPLYNTTKQVSKKMGEMQSKMNDHFDQQSAASRGQAQSTTTAEKTSKPPREDYIEFEEVK